MLYAFLWLFPFFIFFYSESSQRWRELIIYSCIFEWIIWSLVPIIYKLNRSQTQLIEKSVTTVRKKKKIADVVTDFPIKIVRNTVEERINNNQLWATMKIMSPEFFFLGRCDFSTNRKFSQMNIFLISKVVQIRFRHQKFSASVVI